MAGQAEFSVRRSGSDAQAGVSLFLQLGHVFTLGSARLDVIGHLLDLFLVFLFLFRRGLGVRIVLGKENTAQLGGLIFLLVGLIVSLNFLFRRIAVLLGQLVEIEIAQRFQAQHAHDFSIRGSIFHACGFGG